MPGRKVFAKLFILLQENNHCFIQIGQLFSGPCFLIRINNTDDKHNIFGIPTIYLINSLDHDLMNIVLSQDGDSSKHSLHKGKKYKQNDYTTNS